MTQLIRTIHQSPKRTVIVLAGAGISALSELLQIGGASATLIEAVVPYHENAFADFYGSIPEKFVSEATATKLAGLAFTRAQLLSAEPLATIGLACSAAIATNRPKRGKHQACLAYWSAEKIGLVELTLHKGLRTRLEEENLIGHFILNLLAEAMDIPDRLEIALDNQDGLIKKDVEIAQLAKQLIAQEIGFFGFSEHGRHLSQTPRAILSGAFNPLHAGHTGLARAAADQLQTAVTFECAATNVDKPPLTLPVLLSRLAQFAGHWPVAASNAPTYLQKSSLYPGATFVVGFDTAVRLLNLRYYQNSQRQREAAFSQIEANGCSFLVAGRVDHENVFHHVDELQIPAKFRHMFQAISASNFRMDISSTEIRAAKK